MAGNANSGKRLDRVWRNAIMDALAQRKQGAVVDLANALIDKALSGDTTALKEIGDRLDGKPAQLIVGDSEQPIEHTINVHFG